MEVEWQVFLAWSLFQSVTTALLNGDEPLARQFLQRRDCTIGFGDDLADVVLYALQQGRYHYNSSIERIVVVLKAKVSDGH